MFYQVLHVHVTAFPHDWARLLVDRICILAAKLVQRAMQLYQLVTAGLHDMHVRCHVFLEASHPKG
jgi:hypothetical protein